MAEPALQLTPARQTVLLMRVGSALHAIPITAIEEVLPNLPIERVPQCPPHVKGVVFVRGHLIPVLDLRHRLGLGDHGRALDPNIVCIRSGARLIGLEVDEAIDLIDIPVDRMMPSARLGAEASCLIGVVEHNASVIHVLDAERLG